MTDYKFKTEPRHHQAEIFERHRDDPYFALFHEQGLGKSKVAIDVAAYLFLTGKIDGLLIVAPNGVDLNWITDELPAHLPDEAPMRVVRYRARDAGTKRLSTAFESLLATRALAVFVCSPEAFRTEVGKALAKAFLVKRKVMFVVDESQVIKSPNAKRTKTIIAAGKYAHYRWILSGTPNPQNPLDLYAQIRFLDNDFWKKHDIANMVAMRARFEITEPRGAPGRQFNVVVGYRDPELIRDWIKPISDRRLKVDCLDLPPKIYTRRYFEMSAPQRAAYDKLRDDYRIEIDAGVEVSAMNPMVRLLRLQQIACNYVPDPDDADAPPRVIDDATDARLACLADELESIDESRPGAKVIIWHRFRQDGERIARMLNARGADAVRYDGTCTDEEKATNLAAWRRGSPRYFVANPAAAGRGLTLNEAADVVYYDNSFNLEHRIQSEDRCHRIGQARDYVRYVDLLAEDSVDGKVATTLVKKLELSRVVMGDDPREWI